jgi:cell division protein FtsB
METNQTGAAGRKKLYVSLIVALLLINGVTLYFLFSENHEKMDLADQKTALQSNFKSLSDTLDAKKLEIDQYAGKNAALDKSIAEKEDMLKREKSEISSLLAKNKLTTGELAKVTALIAEYKNSISDLQGKVDELTKQNQALAMQNGQLTNDLSTEKQTTSQLSEQNQHLSKKVEVGSLFQVAKLDVEAVKTKGNGKEVEVRRAKAAESLKISFETGENKVLDPGQVSVYVRIINPKGETIAVADQGSGTITDAETSQPVQYTKKADIDWAQSSKKVNVYWNADINMPGVYKVELYQSGHVIGQSEVKLS